MLQISLMIEAAVIEAQKEKRAYTCIFFGQESMVCLAGMGWVRF